MQMLCRLHPIPNRATITRMMNEDRKPPTETDLPPETPPDDETRYAPPEAPPVEAETPAVAVFPAGEGVDIEAALAAVSSLSDMLAEQEAAEQAKIAQAEAEAQAAEERRLRVQHPELFFPVPPATVLRRGQMASVVPALLLIGIGAWLTFALTAAPSPPDGLIMAAVLLGGVSVALLARWLSSGRWARGSLLLGLALLLITGVTFYLQQPGAMGVTQGWPLLVVGLGAAVLLTALLAYPPERRLLLPGALLTAVGLVALVVTLGLLPAEVLALAGTVWPVVLVVVLVVWLLPVVRRN